MVMKNLYGRTLEAFASFTPLLVQPSALSTVLELTELEERDYVVSQICLDHCINQMEEI